MIWQAFTDLRIFLRSHFSSPPPPSSSSSKQRKNVISCVTVHDSPDSDCSSNNSPYAVESRPPNNNNYDTKTTILDNYNNGNPRTIIIPPLKTQSNEVPSECERLMPGEGGRLRRLDGHSWCVAASRSSPPSFNWLLFPVFADATNHQTSAYKFKSSTGVASGNNHLPRGVSGGGSYRQQPSGPHPLQQQQPLNLSQVPPERRPPFQNVTF